VIEGPWTRAAAGRRVPLSSRQTDEHPEKPNWRLLALRGHVVMEAPRYEMIQDTINPLGLITARAQDVRFILRLMGAKVRPFMVHQQ